MGQEHWPLSNKGNIMRQFFKTLTLTTSLSAILCAGSTITAQAQVVEEDAIIVTGSIRSGGAQDIKYFRGGVERGHVPTPKGMTSEGLLNEHDLYLTSSGEACAEILCLNTAAKTAEIVQGDYFAGLGFDTNIDESWQRPPLNLVAVIDRSGSMGRSGGKDGTSMENVKHSLHEIKDAMRPGDQISFVLYGSNVVTHLPPLAVTKASKAAIGEKIDSIAIEGSTNMDAGLARGYDIAYETKAAFDGTTRVMIFTDERPNTGRVDADGFMARAQKASRNGIGLTTIGYGVNYGDALAAKIASVRGGNLFYVGGKSDVETLFTKEFDFMVSEVANDLRVTLTPASGLSVDTVFGVPQDLITKDEAGSVTLNVSTVFMSSAGGGLFVSMTGAPVDPAQPLFEAELEYDEGPIRRRASLKAAPLSEPPLNLVKAEALSAQFTAMKAATTAYYDRDFDGAYEHFRPFANKFANEPIQGLEAEYKLVAALNETLAIQAGRIEDLENPPKYAQLRGAWEVTRAGNMEDVHRGDRFIFTDNKATHFRRSKGFDTPYEDEYYDVNDTQIYLKNSDMTFRYGFSKKGKLRLRHREAGTHIFLKPYIAPDEAGAGEALLD